MASGEEGKWWRKSQQKLRGNPVRQWNRISAVFYMSKFFNSSDFGLTDLGLLSPKKVVVHDGGVVNLDIVINQSLWYEKKKVPNGSKWSLKIRLDNGIEFQLCFMSNFFNSSNFRLTDLELLSPKRVVGHDKRVVNLDIVINRSLRYIENERKKIVPNGVCEAIIRKMTWERKKWSEGKGGRSSHRSRCDHKPIITCDLKRTRVRGNTNLVLTNAMKSPVNAPPSAPRDLETAVQLSQICSHITILNGQINNNNIFYSHLLKCPFRTSNGDDGATVNHYIKRCLF